MYKIDFNKPLHIHFIGIGGISMSGLAHILREKNFTISGSDSSESALTDELTAAGCTIHYPQKAENITDDIDLVVYTAAIREDNPELAAAKKAGRVAAEGLVEAYIHGGGRIGVLVEVNCETDFVAKTDAFKELVKDIAMHIAATNPSYLKREEVPTAELEHEQAVLAEQARNEGKPEKIIEKMVAGRIEKYYKEVCLMEQPFVKDPDKTISDLITESIAKIGENISIRRFTRYQLGEGIEKKEENFAEEVMSFVK